MVEEKKTRRKVTPKKKTAVAKNTAVVVEEEDKRRKRYPKFVKPAGRRLLCKRLPEVESSILHLPTRCTQNSLMFEVLETGPLCIWEHIINPGDFVFTGAHGYVMLPLYKNPDIYIINEDDVLAVVSQFEEDENEAE